MSRKFLTKALGKLTKTKVNYNVDDVRTDEVKTDDVKIDDVIIHVGEESDCKEFHANSNILCQKSDYFKNILSANDIEKKDGKFVIRKPTITPQVFDVIFK